MQKTKNPYVRLAWDTIYQYIMYGRRKHLAFALPAEFNRQAAAFVSIKKDGQLRGCIGTIQPVQSNLAEEIIANAISAASRDPRFPAIKEDELSSLSISVDVLAEPEKVADIGELDPQQFGVIVEKDLQRGVLLPGLEGIDTAEKQLAIALQKAGLSAGEDVQIYRFQVNRYK